MEIRQLRYFVTVARTRHFGRAAERLHMAQSPLSQAIRQLESQLGATLFERTTRRVDLTPAGEAFLVDALRILDSVDAAAERVRRVADGHTGLLRISATGLTAFAQLPQIARIAARELPGLTLTFAPDQLTPAQERGLLDERTDLAVLRPPLRVEGVAARLVCRERLVLAVPREHRLAVGGPGAVALAELRDEDFVVYGTRDSVVDAVVSQVCLSAGFLPRRAHEVAETSIMLTLVAAGLGIALLPGSARAIAVDGVRYLDLADPAHVDVALAWRAGDPSPVLARLLRVLDSGGFFAAAQPAPGPGAVNLEGSR